MHDPRTLRSQLHLKTIFFLSLFKLPFPLASVCVCVFVRVCVFFNAQYVSARKKKNSPNQKSINKNMVVCI